MDKPLWEPSPETVRHANLTAFIGMIGQRYDSAVQNYATLYDWSLRCPEQFWAGVWDFCDVHASRRADKVLVNGERMPGARWFVGAQLNFAENLLHYRDNRPAVIAWTEDGGRRALTYAELADQAGRLAAALQALGVRAGDRVAGYLPNVPEAIIAMLASASLGAIWSSCSPDFGLRGVFDRFGQIEPKVLFGVDGYRYNGKAIDTLARLQEVAKGLPSVRQVVLVPFLKPDVSAESIANAVRFDDLIRGQNAITSFTQAPFDHPLYIMYSSGTTGVPKCIVHGAGGTLIQHLKELVLHTNLKREDRIFYATTCGWMMWNWLVSALAVGATIVLYDGAPLAQDGNVLFNMVDEERITFFGTGAKFIDSIRKLGQRPRETHALASLRAILSTGSPLVPESFDFIYQHVKPDVQLSSISGGTDIISCFALGNPLLPVWRGELQCRGLGMKVEIFDNDARPVKQQKGELVCTAPFPSMPLGFWNDPDDARYRAAYFERFAGVWTHGDYAEVTEHEGLIIYGRSDATLNPGGVRIGTAEIYRIVEQIPQVLESLAVGQEWENDMRVVLFVRLAPGGMLSPQLNDTIKQQIRLHASPRHVPAKVVQINDIPRTLNGKIAELAVSNAIHGRAVKNLDALANPEALEEYRNIAGLNDSPTLRR